MEHILKWQASGNFGNMIAVGYCQYFLTSFTECYLVHILTQNFLNDFAQIGNRRFDNMDADFVRKPQKLGMFNSIKNFMWILGGLLSSIFDVFVFCDSLV